MLSDHHRAAGEPQTTEALTQSFLAQRAELLGRDLVGPDRRRLLGELTDRWIHALFVRAGGQTVGACVVAVGGYGRGELAPGSDLDLVLLHPPAASPARVNEVADALWYPIWDSGIKLDHSVRSTVQMRRLAADDLRVVLGFLDARTVSGDVSLTKSVRESVLADWRGLAPRRLPELHESVVERMDRAGELAYLLEPNLKDSHGGLRDVVALRAVAASWITDAPMTGLVAPRDLLLDVRDVLHSVSGRASDVLVAQDRDVVARACGYAGPDSADDLSRAICAAGRAIAYAWDVTWHRVERLNRRAPRIGRRIGRPRFERVPIAEGAVVQDGEVVLAVDVRPEADPVLILRVAAAAAQAGLRLSPHTVERLAPGVASMPTPWPAQARDGLISLLGGGTAALPVWEALDQHDVWSSLIPHWAAVRSAPQHNPVHRFTVDRHLVETAIQAVPFTRRVDRPDLLLVGALLHDIGKGREGDHTEIGVGIVGDIAAQLGFEPQDCDVLVQMVKHHLLLPETATRRDLDDPATVQAVADALADERLLDLLHALAEADALATGPAAWSGWKKSLIDALVDRTRQELRARTGKGSRDPVDAPSPLRGIAEYDLNTDAIIVQADHDEQVSTITVVAPDRTGVLSTVAGVLSMHRLAVRGAQVETVSTARSGARAVQVWTVQPMFGEPPPTSRLREDITRALAGTLDVGERLAARDTPGRVLGDFPEPIVQIIPAASSRATVLEVRAHDAPGLLHHISGAIAAAGFGITAARVTTLGSEAVDVFYVVDSAGAALAEGDCQLLLEVVTAALTPR